MSYADNRRGSFSFSRNFFIFFALKLKEEIFLALTYTRAHRRDIFSFYRNTLVFLFIKRKVSEEMPFSSEVFRIYSDNFRKNGYNFGRNSNNFGS